MSDPALCAWPGGCGSPYLRRGYCATHVEQGGFCRACGKHLPADDFHSTDRSTCRACNRTRVRKRPTRERARQINLARWYDLSPEQYATLLASQEGRCAICRAKPRQRRLAVDHDHSTGEVRGLLCNPCNLRFVAKVDKDPAMLDRTVRYFQQPPARDALGGAHLVPESGRRA